MNVVEAPPALVVFFVLAIVIGYFIGRTASIMKGDRRG